jgi:patatin-like phospholipase/acyl hydrolase
VLCLDGGGMRGLSMVLLLKELMLQVRIQSKLDFTPEPWQCFDFICGTSTGGLIAVLLGRLGKTLQECEALFRTLGTKIFAEGGVHQKFRLAFRGSKHASNGLREVLQQQGGEQNMFDGKSITRGHVPVRLSYSRVPSNIFANPPR